MQEVPSTLEHLLGHPSATLAQLSQCNRSWGDIKSHLCNSDTFWAQDITLEAERAALSLVIANSPHEKECIRACMPVSLCIMEV